MYENTSEVKRPFFCKTKISFWGTCTRAQDSSDYHNLRKASTTKKNTFRVTASSGLK